YPLGGQGLNTGMQDAFALGWRLAAVLAGRADPGVLDDYSRERVAVAAAVVGNTVLQSRMMNPRDPDLRDAVLAMLAVPAVHDAVAELISGQFQPGFQHDLVVTGPDGTVTTLAGLLRAGRFVAIRPDEHTPVPDAPADALVVTGKVTPDQVWTTAVIRPDGYLAATRWGHRASTSRTSATACSAVWNRTAVQPAARAAAQFSARSSTSTHRPGS